MGTYITTDIDGNVTASADWEFPGSVIAAEEVVRGYDGKLYIKGEEPQKSESELKAEQITSLKYKLDALDTKYITPRVLAGLATGDSYAKTQWTQHETEAAPIRTQISELSKQ